MSLGPERALYPNLLRTLPPPHPRLSVGVGDKQGGGGVFLSLWCPL